MTEVADKLNSKGLYLTKDALSFLCEDNPSASFDQLWEKALELDLRESCVAKFPLNIANAKQESKVDGPLVVQLQSIRDVGAPKTNQKMGNHSQKMLLLQVTDGHTLVRALEYSPCPQLSAQTAPGSKFILKNARVFNGTILLNKDSIEYIGGKVDRLLHAWNLKNSSLVRRNPTAKENPPPPFVALQITQAPKSASTNKITQNDKPQPSKQPPKSNNQKTDSKKPQDRPKVKKTQNQSSSQPQKTPKQHKSQDAPPRDQQATSQPSSQPRGPKKPQETNPGNKQTQTAIPAKSEARKENTAKPQYQPRAKQERNTRPKPTNTNEPASVASNPPPTQQKKAPIVVTNPNEPPKTQNTPQQPAKKSSIVVTDPNNVQKTQQQEKKPSNIVVTNPREEPSSQKSPQQPSSAPKYKPKTERAQSVYVPKAKQEEKLAFQYQPKAPSTPAITVSAPPPVQAEASGQAQPERKSNSNSHRGSHRGRGSNRGGGGGSYYRPKGEI